MFNFIKKAGGGSGNVGEREKMDREEKERRKREKKLRKEAKNFIASTGAVSGSMSTEELLRLDEVRKSLKIRGGKRKEKEKLPSGITADYSAEFFAALDIDRSTLTSGDESVGGSSIATNEQDRGSDEIIATVSTIIDYRAPQRSLGSSSNAVATTLKYRSLPQVPPKPPKRGILKGSRSNIANIHEELIITTPDPQLLLMRNTIQNELLYESGAGSSIGTLGSVGSSISPRGTSFTSVDSLRSDEGRPVPHSPLSNLHVLTSPSPSAESLTDTTNSSFATPLFSMSPVGESQGSDRWSRVHNFEDINLPLPPIQLVQLPASRVLMIRRQKPPRQDFGFSLRKAIYFDRSESLLSPTLHPVIFAEPGAGGGSTGLLPGDRLLKVNGTEVKDLSREVIIEMIRNSGDYVTVEVQPVYELVELSRRCMSLGTDGNEDYGDELGRGIKVNCSTLKRSASKRFKQQVHNGIENYDANIPNSSSTEDLVWLVHRGGFCAAVRLPQQKAHLESHKVVVQLLHNGEKLTVDEDDIEKQNPTTMNQVEDICELKHLNESSVLNCVRQRFGSNLIHTKAGPVMMIVNPMAPLSLYSEKVVSMFRGCKTEDMPPHIYSLAQTAYRTLLETRRDQSLIFMGRSGSGKTTSFKHALYFLALAAGSYNNLFTAEKVNAVNTILEAFGNTKNCLNTNATRFTQIFSLDFDQTGQIASASVQVLLPERQIAGKRPSPNDHSFLIMTRLVAGAEGQLQKELHLDNISSEDNHPFVSLPQKLDERHRAAADFIRTVKAFDVLNIDPKAVRGIWNILASIYHLGIAGATKSGSGASARSQFADPIAARKASGLLGVSMDDLLAASFNTNSSTSSSPSKTPSTDTLESAWDSLEALVVGLYAEALAAVVALINKNICTSAHAIASILLLDTPGFQNPASCGGAQSGATLSDLRHNYLQERLQMLYHHNTLIAPKDRYAQELIEIDTEGISESHPGAMISLIDKAPQNHVVRTSQRDLRDQDRRGLLWLLDEESMYPNSNDDTFLERLFSHYGDREYQSLLRKCTGPKQFVLHHLQGTNPVLYNADGWVHNSREHSSIRNAASLLQDSSKDEISRLYVGNLSRTTGGMIFCGSIVGLDGTQSLRRVSSIRRSFTSAGVKRNSILLQMKFTVDGIIDTLRRTGTHFVHCFLLQHNAGKYSTTPGTGGSPNAVTLFNTGSNGEDIINIPLLRSQVRGSQILEAARLHRMGFPESVPLTEFVRRFSLLAGDAAIVKDTTVEDILTINEIDTATYRVGPSQIFFRSGVLCELEAKRDVLLADRIIQFQACCRGYLARKQIARRRVQELAVRCIQRNVKSFLAVRDWPWWRLLVRVTPLLNVHRTEEQLKTANEELVALKTKLEKIENERNLLKTDNQKLETKPEESTTSTHAHSSTSAHPSDSVKQHATPVTTSTVNSLGTGGDNNASTVNNNKRSRLVSDVTAQNNNKFLKRVLAAIMDSKTLTINTTKNLAPQKTKPTTIKQTLTMNYRGANNSNSSISSITSQPSATRPPVPPQAHDRLRKQTKLTTTVRTKSERCQSPTTLKSSTPLRTNFDSDDGLLKSACNGFALNEVGTMAGLSAPNVGMAAQSAAHTQPTPIKVSLNFSLTKSDSMSSVRSERFRERTIAAPRSPSPAFSFRTSTSSRCSSVSSRGSYNKYSTTAAALQTPPRRVFPQSYTRGNASLDLSELRQLEAAPVVFDANLSFVLGCKKQPVYQGFRPSPSHQDPQTSSAYLTEKIQNFLRRTDHVHEEWSALNRRSKASSGCSTPTNSVYDDYDTISLIERQRERASMERCSSLGRSRSAQNILTKAYQLSKTLPRTPTSRSNSVAKDYPEDDDDRTIHEENDTDLDELSEMTIDFTEERSAANINGERLEAETAERLKLEKELSEQQNKVKSLQETTEKLEMELICAKSDLNGVSEDEEHDNEDGVSGVYKLKYDRIARELEFTKRRLQTQHEHDLEQLVGLKKQLEKKLSDAYEEVEEQRQVVGQWKRKTQKMTNEMNDLRMMLEEQNVRNNLLEKKQRKFDAECQALQDAARQERQAKDRLSREMDVLIAEKFSLEQSLADTRLDLDLKEEKLGSLQRELEEMTFGVGTEEEIAQLRRSKNELDRRVKEQDEELDEMAGQVQLLEQAKLRLEMSLETMRKEARRDAQQRDEELEETRGNAYKKIKALECQLESEHEERTLLLREKHELERRLAAADDQERVDKQAEEAANQKLRRDLRKYKALLKDCQTQLERLKADTPGKALVRQLRNQLEDAESARGLVMKARQAAEAELTEVQAMFEEANRGRHEAEERALASQRERTALQAQIEENEEELAELMKKYSSTVKQLNTEQIAASEYEFKLSELEAERNNLKDQVSELQQRLENVENLSDPSAAMMSKRLELRSKELESRLELEQATRTRLEVQVTRHKEALEKLQQEVTQAKVREKQAQDLQKKSQKSLRELREEFHDITGREQESIVRRKDLEKKLEQSDSDASSLRNDLRLALQRIADLQQAMEEEVDDGDAASESDESMSSESSSMVDLEERLRPIHVKSNPGNPTTNNASAANAIKLLVHEKDDSSPRITLTSPSSNNIHKTTVVGKTSAVNILEKNPQKHSGNLNGDTSFA